MPFNDSYSSVLDAVSYYVIIYSTPDNSAFNSSSSSNSLHVVAFQIFSNFAQVKVFKMLHLLLLFFPRHPSISLICVWWMLPAISVCSFELEGSLLSFWGSIEWWLDPSSNLYRFGGIVLSSVLIVDHWRLRTTTMAKFTIPLLQCEGYGMCPTHWEYMNGGSVVSGEDRMELRMQQPTCGEMWICIQ